jgi:hypothetical protein
MAAKVEESFQMLSNKVSLKFNLLARPSIQYKDEDGITQDIDSSLFFHRNENGYGVIYLKSGESWPTADEDELEPYTITYDAGISSDRSQIPDDIKSAIHLMIARMYTHREDHVKRFPSQAESLLHYHRNAFV